MYNILCLCTCCPPPEVYKLYFYIDYLGKYKILNKSCIFWVLPMLFTVCICAEIAKWKLFLTQFTPKVQKGGKVFKVVNV